MEPSSSSAPQSPAETSAAQCKEIKANGDRCGVSKGISPNGYCNSHNPDKLCCGERKNGDKCKAPRMPDYDYCMPQHDPTLKYVDPALFRSGRLRGDTAMVREVFTSEGCEDAYLGGRLPEESYLDGGNYHLDHVVECQVVAAIFSKLSVSADCEEKTVAVLHDITNDPKNLRLTATWANMAKEVAIKEFLNNWRIRPASEVLPFADYLGKATWWSSSTSTMCRFDETQVARLCGVMATAMQSFLVEIESKRGDFPSKKIYHDVEKVATDVYSAMKLNVPQSKQASKPKDSTDKPKKEPKTRVSEEKAEEKVQEKRREHKVCTDANDNDSDTSSYSDSGNDSDSDGSPGRRSQAVTMAKAKPTPKKNTGKPKESSTTRVTEDAKAKAKAKRRVRKSRAEEDDSYSDTSNYSDSGSDTDSDESPGPRSETASKPTHKEKADKPEKILKTRVKVEKTDEIVKQKRRMRKPRVDEDDSYSDNSDSDSDSDSGSDSDDPPRPRRQTTSKAKSKESTDKPKKPSTTRIVEEKTKAKVKPKRRVRKTRADEDDSYSDNSDSDSDSASDEPSRRPRSKKEKEATAIGERDKGAKEAAPKRPSMTLSRRSTKERKDATADEDVAPSSPPVGTAVGRRGPTVEPADKPRIRAHSTKKAA